MILAVGKEQALFAPGRKLAAGFLGKCLGLLPGGFDIAGQQDQVVVRLSVLAKNQSGIDFIGL